MSRAAKGADCKSAAETLRRFESCRAHQQPLAAIAQVVERFLGKKEVPGSNLGGGSETTHKILSFTSNKCKEFAPMAKKGSRMMVKLKSTESHHIYYTEKNKRNTTERLELRKYDPVLRRHVIYKETK